MSILEKLLKIDGVIAAGGFKENGEYIEHKGDLSKADAITLSEYCATINKLFDMTGKMHTKTTKLELTPLHGFVHCGGKYTLFTGATHHYAVADDTADWNEVSWAVLEGKFPEDKE